MVDNIVSAGQLVVLREKRIDDAEADYQWRVDPELAELDATVSLRQSFKSYLKDYEDELNSPIPWVQRYAIDTLDGKHIGNCMVYDIDTVTGQCELGILIGDRDYWGFGYGRDAMKQLIAECFMERSMKRVYLHTLQWNARARRAFAGCGFREIGPVRRAGKDFIRMELTRDEWEVLPSVPSAHGGSLRSGDERPY